jgi:hypothetical protein
LRAAIIFVFPYFGAALLFLSPIRETAWNGHKSPVLRRALRSDRRLQEKGRCTISATAADRSTVRK